MRTVSWRASRRPWRRASSIWASGVVGPAPDGGPARLDPVPRLGGRASAAIFTIALAARLAAVTWAGWTSLGFGDGPAYLFAARELVRTGSYPIATERLYFRAPGYPVFLAGVTLGRPGSPSAAAVAKGANAVLGALATLLIAAISARLFRRRWIAVVTALAAGVHPGLVSLSTEVESEPLFLLLLLCSGFLLLAAADRPSSNLGVAAGIVLALAALTRPSALAVAPFLAAPLFDRRYPPRARAHIAASALLGLILALAPWTLRNALVFHEFLPVNDAAGSAFYQGNSDWTVRFYELRTRGEYDVWSRAMFTELERETARLAQAGLSPGARSRHFMRKAIEERRQDPGGWGRLLLRKAADFARPGPNPMFWPRSVVVPVSIFGGIVSILALVGSATAPRRGAAAFAAAFLVVTLAFHALLIVVWRYRIPYWDPVLLLYAVPGGAKILRR